MTRKHIDAAGRVVEVEDTADDQHVVGAIGTPVTAQLEPTVRDWKTALLAWWTAKHLKFAFFVRRRILLMGSVDFKKLEDSQRTIALQLNGQARMISEVRTRLAFHEHGLPLLGESRRHYDAQMVINEKRIAERLAGLKAEVVRRGGKPE
jgi:hypothetical protein